MKRLNLTAALLLLGMLTGSPKVSAQQIEPINLGCTENLRIIFGQEAPDFCRSAEADSGLLFNGFEVKEGADRSIQIDMKVFNRGSADALVEVYDARGNLVDLKVIDGNNPPTGFLQSGWDLFTKVPASFFSRYPIGDSRRNLQEQSVSVTIPAGGYVDITKSSDMAYWYNAIIAAVDLIQLAQGDPDFVQSEAMTKEVALGFVEAYRDKAVVNIFKSEPVAEGIFSLDFLDRDKLIEVLAEFLEWFQKQESSGDPSKSPLTGAFSNVFLDTANVGIEIALDRALPRLGTFARAVRQGGSALNTAARVLDLYHNYFVAEEKAVVTLRNTAAPSSNFNDAVASVNQQLWGTWETEYKVGQFASFIFTPQNQGFVLPLLLSSQPYIAGTAQPFRYEVNSSYQPMHIDFVYSEGARRRGIFEFTADGQLRLELSDLNPDNGLSNFTSRAALFTKISNTADLPPNIEVVDGYGQIRRELQAEAKNDVGAMIRTQQAYYLEYDKFATNIQELNIEIQPETYYYRYRITTGNARVFTIITAQAKRSGIRSYTGVAWVSPRNGENIIYARFCETNELSMSVPSIISQQTNTGLEYQCGNDSRDLNE